MDVPTTVTTALEDRPVRGATCLEAGAGVGNASAGLLAAGGARVYAVTNEREHAEIVRARLDREWVVGERVVDGGAAPDDDAGDDRLAVLEADLRKLPLASDSVSIITAHCLFNLVPPESLPTIAAELTRVAAPGCHLVVDDYAPLPDDAAVREFFAVRNAIEILTTGDPALTFYPTAMLRRTFAGYGWAFDRERTLLEPVPWTANHIDAHLAAARSSVASSPIDFGEALLAEADRLATVIGAESVGELYSVAMRLPDRT